MNKLTPRVALLENGRPYADLMRKATHHADAEVRFRAKLGFVLKDDWLANWEGEAPAEPRRSVEIRLGGSLALPKKRLLK